MIKSMPPKKTKKQIEEDKFLESIQKTIYQTPMGMVISPYKLHQAYWMEREDGEWDKIYHKLVPYTGFRLPYKGAPAYLTHPRPFSALKRAFPEYSVVKIPMIQPKEFSDHIFMQNIESLRAAQSDIVEQIMANRYKENIWFVNLQTGLGKTILATYVASKFNYKTWVMCFSSDILTQWENTFMKYTTIDPDRMLRVRGREITKILAGDIDPDDYDVYISTPLALDLYLKKRGDYSRLYDIFEKLGIGFLIYDEAHRNVANIVRFNACLNLKYSIYLSADYGQGNETKDYQFKKVFENVHLLTPADEVRKSLKYTKVVAVEFMTDPTRVEQDSIFDGYGYDAGFYMAYEFGKGQIVNIIKHIIKKYVDINNKYHRTLILFNNIIHCDIMTYILKKEFPEMDIGAYHSKVNPVIKETVKETADIIVSTYSSFGTGLDTEDIKFVISTDNCNKVIDNQAAGRSRALKDGSDSLYLILVDMGFNYNKRKLKKRLGYLKETKSKNDKIYRYEYNFDDHKSEFDDPKKIIDEAVKELEIPDVNPRSGKEADIDATESSDVETIDDLLE